MKYFFSALLCIAGLFSVHAQLIVDIYPSEQQLIQSLIHSDNSVKINNLTFGGAHQARGIFYNKNTPLPLDSGVLITTGFASGAAGSNMQPDYTGVNRMKGDQDIHFLAGYKTYDAFYISFDLTTTQNLLKFDYVFASEEYPEYAGSPFNDMFAFILTDKESGETQNLAVIPNTTIPIMVNTLNHRTYADFYIDNTKKSNHAHGIQYDGFTQPLIAYAEVAPNKKYNIKIVIADVGDDALDSGVFIKGKSFESVPSADFYAENEVYFETFEKGIKSDKTEQLFPKDQKTKNNTDVKKTPREEPQTTTLDSVVIYFDFDAATPISSSAQNGVNKLKTLNANNYQLEIRGHTDQKGNLGYNQNLSEARARNIEQLLHQHFNTDMKVSWYAFKQPVTPLLTESERAKNRRVVIYLRSKN